MIGPLAFWLFLFGALATGWLAGDRRDRPVLVAIALAAMLTGVTGVILDFRAWRVSVIVINLVLLFFVGRHALFSRRLWPIWFTGFHAASTMIGIAALLFVEYRGILVLAETFWSLPALAALFLGTLSDQRRGVA